MIQGQNKPNDKVSINNLQNYQTKLNMERQEYELAQLREMKDKFN